MKKWIYFSLGILALMLLGNGSGKDVGKLRPVQVVCLSRVDDQVKIWTDTEDAGTGHDLISAAEDMKEAAPAEIFLETADYLLVAPDCVDLLANAATILRPSCSICLMEGSPDMKQVGQFLVQHIPRVTLMEYGSGERQLQTLQTIGGRMTLVS